MNAADPGSGPVWCAPLCSHDGVQHIAYMLQREVKLESNNPRPRCPQLLPRWWEQEAHVVCIKRRQAPPAVSKCPLKQH